MEDLLSDPSEDNVSDVDPEELQKMLEGLDFSDEESNVRPNAKKTTTSMSYSKVPKSSNLKSSIKTTSTTASANGSGMALGSTNTGGDNPRKVQFSKDTKPAATHFDRLDASNESSTFTGLESPGKKQQLLSTSSDTTAVSSTTSAAVPTSSSKAGNNVGHPNKSKVMHELFGIEKSAAAGTANNGNNASDLRDAKMTTATRARNTPVKMDEDDDLFAGLGEPKIKAKPTANNDFMSSLFGSDGNKNSNRRGSTTKEFVLEDKYTKKPELNPPRGPGRRGSGTPFLNTEQPKIPEPVIPQQPSQPPSHTQLEFTEAPTPTIRTPTSSSNVVNDNLQKQMNQMEEFEREQNSKFLREIEDHKRQLEMQQMEHRNILDQQRNMAKEQLRVLQDRQSSALLQQQNQSEMLMKQLQSQMEAEMRMKTELVRHQMQILSEVQSDSDFNEVISRFAAPNSTKAKGSSEEMYKKREDRLKAAHAEEIEEMQKRLAHWSRRVQQMSEEHQKELENEREKRKRDLKEQSEDHKATVDTIRADYAVLVDKIKELKTLELEASYETRDSSKAIDTLLNQMSLNMDEVQGLRHGLEDRISKHVDVREALLKKKDEQLQALQKELIKKGQENQLEQKELKEMVEKLQNQLSSRDVELRSKEIELHRRQNSLDEERRKFETEKEITLAKLKEDQVRLQEQKVHLSEERRQLHRAVEKEHRLIVAERAKAAIGKRLHGQSQDNHFITKSDKAVPTFEIEAMIKAVESEKCKMKDEWKLIKEAKEKLKEKRGLLREDKKLLDVAMKKLANIDHHLESRLDKISNLADDSGRVKKECQQMMNEVKAIEASRAKAISEAKSEAVQRLEAVEREAQRLEALREAVNKERRKLLHTQSAILCSRCTKPIIIEDHSKELSNLGLRTAGDGETISSSIHQFASLRKDALRDQEYLARESRYLQSIAVADL